MVKEALKYTCLFGGGAVRGVAYVGTLQAIEELGIEFDTIAGSSVGALVAALMAVGYSAEELKNLFLGINFELFKDLQFGFGPKFAISKGEVFLEWVRELIELKVYGDKYKKGKNKPVTFKDIGKNLIIITTDLSNFKSKEFSPFVTPDFEIASAIRISCAMPGLMKPIEYENTLLVDGDLQKSIPMWKLSTHCLETKNRIAEFRLEGDSYGGEKNALDFINTIYTCVTSISTEYLTELYGSNDMFDYVTINTGDVIIVDFNCSKGKREELIQKGYEQTIEYFRHKLPLKKEILLKEYNEIYSILSHVEKQIIRSRIIKAKSLLGDLFVKLAEYKDNIDIDLYNRIKDFYSKFVNNIRYPALFGNVKLRNSVDIEESLSHLTELISDKIYELEYYLVKFPI